MNEEEIFKYLKENLYLTEGGSYDTEVMNISLKLREPDGYSSTELGNVSFRIPPSTLMNRGFWDED